MCKVVLYKVLVYLNYEVFKFLFFFLGGGMGLKKMVFWNFYNFYISIWFVVIEFRLFSVEINYFKENLY